jgi:uncharacterized protein YxjI
MRVQGSGFRVQDVAKIQDAQGEKANSTSNN